MSKPPTIPSNWRQVRLVTICPPGYPHSQAFAEVVDFIRAGLEQLGIEATCAVNSVAKEGVNLIFGAHLLSADAVDSLPANIVIYNLEQLAGNVHQVYPHYSRLLTRFPVWDYSPRNIARCRDETGSAHVHYVGIGYARGVKQIPAALEQPIDVLFYGCVNERRKAIIERLRGVGLNVESLFNVYGAEREAAIARSKVVLNVHYFPGGVHEIARTAHLLANRKAVVTECDENTEIDDDLRRAMAAAPYDELVDACVEVVRNDALRRRMEMQGFEIFSQRDQSAMLAQAIAETSPPLPRRINLGSGKSWRPDCVNIDVEPLWNPDLLADLSDPKWLGRPFFSERFGLQWLEPDAFDEIVAQDVLEHVPNLTGLMTGCLELLTDGGRMVVGVPYDLSYGAWQDPTHVRAFNERSWLYYTDWHWYLGWTGARFDVESLKMGLSPLGLSLKETMPLDQICRQPRAVDSMEVVLVKRPLTEDERKTALDYHRGPWRPSV